MKSNPVFVALLLLLTCAGLTRNAAAAPPNVILIISDDHGFPDYGFMGCKFARTPNLDRLAGESLLYTRGYTMPVCSPSLACLLTGQLPHVHGITGNDLTKAALAAENAKGIKGREPLSKHLLGNSLILPRTLTEAGYLTIQTGKLWNTTAREVGFTDGMTNKEGRHGGDGLTIGRESMQPIFDFITDAETKKKPFFVWYAPLLPHQPHNPPAELLAKYQDKGLSQNAAKYFAMVEWFDQTIGELDSFLKKENRYVNTIIIYLADNGWDPDQGNRAKLSPYERGIRTPIIVRWSGKVQPLRDDETLASIIDIVPTTLKACGLNVPANLPGINLLDRPAMTARKSIFVESYTHDIAELGQPEKSLVARVVINGWSKLILPGTNRPDKAFTSAPKEIELYDLKADPFEKENLAAQQPEQVKRLQAIQNSAWNTTKSSEFLPNKK
jgi:arylsulfatase A-like enzyme